MVKLLKTIQKVKFQRLRDCQDAIERHSLIHDKRYTQYIHIKRIRLSNQGENWGFTNSPTAVKADYREAVLAQKQPITPYKGH